MRKCAESIRHDPERGWIGDFHVFVFESIQRQSHTTGDIVCNVALSYYQAPDGARFLPQSAMFGMMGGGTELAHFLVTFPGRACMRPTPRAPLGWGGSLIELRPSITPPNIRRPDAVSSQYMVTLYNHSIGSHPYRPRAVSLNYTTRASHGCQPGVSGS